MDIDVPYDVAEFPAGLQHMSGDAVLSFARTLEADNDWYRVERQDVVLRALWSKIIEPRYLLQVARLADRFLDDALTDLSKAQVTCLACLMARLSPEDIENLQNIAGAGGGDIDHTGFFTLLPRRAQIDLLVAEFLEAV